MASREEDTKRRRMIGGGRYVIVAPFGKGGMALLYRGFDSVTNRSVIVKVPRPDYLRRPGYEDRFCLEMRSQMQLAHPHVLPVLHMGWEGKVPFAVLPFLAGGSLEDLLQRDRPWAIRALPRWVKSVASALDFLHRRDYLHRDVKPGNLLFDEHGVAHLSDFGVVRLPDDGNGSANSWESMADDESSDSVGTPAYMAPEMIAGETTDGRADQFALGVTVFESLTGRRPFEGDSAVAMLLNQTKRHPDQEYPGERVLPEPVRAIMRKVLSARPGMRYESCLQFADALAAELNDQVLHKLITRQRTLVADNNETSSSPATSTRITRAQAASSKSPTVSQRFLRVFRQLANVDEAGV